MYNKQKFTQYFILPIILSILSISSFIMGIIFSYFFLQKNDFQLRLITPETQLKTSEQNQSKPSEQNEFSLSWQPSCGSPSGSDKTWWPVMGSSETLTLINERYCGDAFLVGDKTQIASFTSKRDAEKFAHRLSRETNQIFWVGSPSTIGPKTRLKNPEPNNSTRSAVNRIDITFNNRNSWIATMPNRTMVLTFDDGPSPDYTPRILEKLRKHNVKATFFLVGYRVKQHCDLVHRIIQEGHELGNHTFSHPYLTKLSPKLQYKEIDKTQKVIRNCVGDAYVPKWFRAPYADQNQITLNILKELNLSSSIWSVDTNDWRITSTSKTIAKAVIASNGKGIVLMHDGTEPNPEFNHPEAAFNRNATVNALDLFLEPMISDNILFVNLSSAFGNK